jgi:translation initiation factor IF-2
MRARGAKSTDIAVLVVAADDGVMPQTIEALNHAQAADVPIVVAVNKIDKEAPTRSGPRQLSEYGLVPEEYGGDTMFVDVSAVTRRAWTAARGDRPDRRRGAWTCAPTRHARPGRRHRGAPRQGSRPGRDRPGPARHAAHGATRSCRFGSRPRPRHDQRPGETVDEAPPSMPVQVLGLTSVPGAGDNFLVVEDDRMARQIADKREARQRAALLARKTTRRKTLDQLFEQLEKGETRSSSSSSRATAGSVEALEDSLAKIEVGDEVSPARHRPRCRCDHRDQRLAGRGLRRRHHRLQRPCPGKATQMADSREGVDIRYYSVIYAAIDEIEAALKGMLKPIFERRRWVRPRSARSSGRPSSDQRP